MKRRRPNWDNFRGHRLVLNYPTASATCAYCRKDLTFWEIEDGGVKRCKEASRAKRFREALAANQKRMTEIVAVSGKLLSLDDEGKRFPGPVFFVRDATTNELRVPTAHEVACLLWRCWRGT